MEQIIINYSRLWQMTKGNLSDGSKISWDANNYRKGYVIYQNGIPVSNGYFKPLKIESIEADGLVLQDFDYKIKFKLSKFECKTCGIMPILK